MDYLTVKEAAEKWGLGTRIVTLYCVEGRIAGASLFLVRRPVLCHFGHHCNHDAILDTMVEDRLRLIYEAELAYLRGDFAREMQCYHKTGEDDGQ